MASILSIGTAVPSHAASAEQISAAANKWLAGHNQHRLLFDRFLTSAKSESRFLIIPPEDVLQLRGPQHRVSLFEEHAPALATTAAASALSRAGISPEEIDTLIFTSCTAPVIPSIDGLVIESLALRPTTKRIPIYQHGCAGGVVGLSLASRLITPGNFVALISVELCSLVFFADDLSPAHLVGTAIFGDGASCVVISPEDQGLTFVDKQSFLLPNTRHLMGYDIMDNGAHLRLDKELPSALASATPQIVKTFLAQHNLIPADIAWWLFHPGGVKILDCLEQAFCLEPEQARWSRSILSRYGNLSSSSVLFVLSDFIESKNYNPGDYVLMLGVGPGLTLELILFEYRA